MPTVRRTIACAAVFFAMTATGCATSSPPVTQPEHLKSTRPSPTATTRQTDDAGRPLPFETEFTERWSNLNDGSAYEPCTALDSEEVASLGLDPDSVSDAALANYQTARGCGWQFTEANTSTLSQGVGNDLPLRRYKEKYAVNINWLYDTTISGRTVTVGQQKGLHSCMTAVQSGSAIVTTIVIISVNPPPTPEICAKAIAFTRATIDKMPS